jgi:hypothetical protein
VGERQQLRQGGERSLKPRRIAARNLQSITAEGQRVSLARNGSSELGWREADPKVRHGARIQGALQPVAARLQRLADPLPGGGCLQLRWRMEDDLTRQHPTPRQPTQLLRPREQRQIGFGAFRHARMVNPWRTRDKAKEATPAFGARAAPPRGAAVQGAVGLMG